HSHQDTEGDCHGSAEAIDRCGDDEGIDHREEEMQRHQREHPKGKVSPHDGVHGSSGTPRRSSTQEEEDYAGSDRCLEHGSYVDALPRAPLLMLCRFHLTWLRTHTRRRLYE